MPPARHHSPYEEETGGPRAPLGTPVRKPFLNRLDTLLRYRIRPVPVTFLRFAFSDQLTVQPSCQRLSPQRGSRKRKIFGHWEHTFAGLSSRVATRSAHLLLEVEGPAAEDKRRVNSRNPRVLSSLGLAHDRLGFSVFVRLDPWGLQTYPQRLQRPWVLLWLPRIVRGHGRKIEVLEKQNVPLAKAGGSLG